MAWLNSSMETAFRPRKKFYYNFMNGTLGPASEEFRARAGLWCIVLILIADRRYCRCVHIEAQIQSYQVPSFKFFLLCFSLSLSSPLPVFNFLMNSCWQPWHFTSSWQVKQTYSLRTHVNAQADQNMCDVT